MNRNILIVGVGGQGTLLASRILGRLAINLGFDCKLSEVHGMAQRGGSVVTHVKMGDKIHSPIIEEGDADIILAFEKIEGARYISYLKKDGVLLVSVQEIYPMPVIVGSQNYPSNILNEIKNKVNVVEMDALKIADELKNPRTVNVIMLGRLAKAIGISYDDMEKAVRDTVPEKSMEVNLKALKRGYEY